MSENEQPAEEPQGVAEEWEYAAPPTAYDLVRDNLAMRLLRLIVHAPFRLLMMCYHRISSAGAENVLDNVPCVITPNHTSNLDNVAIFASLPWRCVNTVCSVAAKDYYFNNAVLAIVARLVANGIPLDHKGANKRPSGAHRVPTGGIGPHVGFADRDRRGKISPSTCTGDAVAKRVFLPRQEMPEQAASDRAQFLLPPWHRKYRSDTPTPGSSHPRHCC